MAGLIAAAATPPATAQPTVTTAAQPTTTNLYASERIELLPGFETTTNGFEAKIKLLEATAGRWSAPLPWPPYVRNVGGPVGMIGIHTHVLPDGKVLTWEGHNDNLNQGHLSHAYTWNPDPNAAVGGYTYPNVYLHYDNNVSNTFCSGHAFLADGRLLVAGGHFSNGEVSIRGNATNSNPPYDTNIPINNPGNLDYVPWTSAAIPGVNSYIGLRDVNIFNYTGYSQSQGPDTNPGYAWQTPANYPFGPFKMTYRRWYPTATTLADGRVLVTAGQRYGGPIGTTTAFQAEIPEVFTPTSSTSGTWQVLTSAQRRLPNYPWMFQAPDGRVFNAGPNYHMGFLNLTANPINGTNPGEWSPATGSPLPNYHPGPIPAAGNYEDTPRGYGSAVLYQPGKLMILGGANSQEVTNTTELIDLNQANPQWQWGAPMRYPRFHANATLLPDGTVLVTGGTTQNSSSDAPAVLPTELWTPNSQLPAGGSWQQLANLDVPRLYHSTAVLLPDATVLTAGGGQGANYTDHPDYQVFTPPYLCQPGAVRPVIGHVPPAVAYGQTLRVETPDAASIARATLVRLSSVTHSFNMNQRFLELAPQFVAYSGGADYLSMTAPTNANECPPGHYMLFLLNQQGVPSVASIVSISANACAASLSLTATLTASNDCQKTYRFTLSNPVNCQADYQWWVNGTAQPARQGQTYIDCTLSPTLNTVAVRVEATRTCAGVTVAAERGQTAYFPGCPGSPN